MILQRENLPNITNMTGEMRLLLGQENMQEITALANYYQLCRGGVNEVGTKLENLDADYQLQHDHNPIHHIEQRMKDIRSLLHKLRDKGYPMSFASIRDHIYDIGGLRVVTNYVDDVYTIAENLLEQDDVTLIEEKDYIKNPKPSGYRSLHLVVSVPVFQSEGVADAPVEIQLRTVGMDMWASLEHKLRYKTKVPQQEVDQYAAQLVGYANDLAEIENNMQRIFKALNGPTAQGRAGQK